MKNQSAPWGDVLFYENPGDEVYFGEVYRTALQEAWLPEGAEAWARTGKSRRGRRPTQQGPGAQSPQPSQAAIRRCFSICAENWRDLPWDYPPDHPCYDTATKDFWLSEKNKKALPCGYYDYYMRCCMVYCLVTGCVLPEANCFTWDPDSTQEAAYPYRLPIYVIGGTPPYEWSVSPSTFILTYLITTTRDNSITAQEDACGTAIITVKDACGRQTQGVVTSPEGQWCVCYSHGTGGTPDLCGPGEFTIRYGPLKITGRCASNAGLFSVTFDCLANCGAGPTAAVFPPPNPCGGTQEACEKNGVEACCRYFDLKIEIWVC